MTTSTETTEAGVEDQRAEAIGLPLAGSSLTTDEKITNIKSEGNDSNILAANDKLTSSSGSTATGPRTPEGKDKSKHNALKHGVFSDVVVLSFESKSQFESLLRGLRDDLKPLGTLEETLVAKLATIIWRHRRLLQAEGAAVHKSIKEGESAKADWMDRACEFDCLLDSCLARTDTAGLISKIDDPTILEACLDKLGGVKLELEKFDLHHETFPILLGRVYGARYEGRNGTDVFDLYRDCLMASGQDRKRREECFQKFKNGLESEIQRLNALRKPPPSSASPDDEIEGGLKLTGMELLQCVVPKSPELDRLLRYEASLERAFDRVLGQLERLQRTRRGQPVAPPIDMHLHM